MTFAGIDVVDLSNDTHSAQQHDDAALRERVRHLMNSASDRAEQLFRTAVRPIYWVTADDKPDQLGSAVLIKIDNVSCLLTAAHVIDENRASSLYVGGNDKLVQINAEFRTTIAENGDRDSDHYDFAIAELPEAMLAEMSSLKFITEAEMAPPSVRGEKQFYTALGYPNSKNKQNMVSGLKVRGQLFSYSSFERFQSELALKLDVSGDEHLFIDHRKHSRDECRKKVSSVAPRGLSGGAIVHAADFSDREVLLGRKPPVPRFAGVTIELYTTHQTLLGTRIGAITSARLRSSMALPVGMVAMTWWTCSSVGNGLCRAALAIRTSFSARLK